MSTTAAEAVAGAAFMGYMRPGGRVGVRNHLAVVSTVALANRVAELAAGQCERHLQRLPASPGDATRVLRVAGEFQRGLQNPDARLQDEVLQRIAGHPNIGAALVLCHDRRAAQAWQQRLSASGKPIEVLAVMDCTGVQDAIDRATSALLRLAQPVQALQREPCPLAALTFALECGGSDASSAVCANPAIGRFVDAALAAGATAIVSETAEFIGAEAVVRRQSATPEIAEAIVARIAAVEARMAGDGDHYRGVNPTAENIEAGLTTLVEKTMGAVCKIGRSRFVGCLDFGQQPPEPGLYFMDTPFFSPCSITGMLAGGAQLTLFAMGVFNPSGNPLAPTLKICGNPETTARWADGIDLDLGALTQGEISLDAAGARVAEAVLRTAGGQATRTEAWGEGQFIIPRMLPTF